ncbi:hypothetical protein LMG28138_04045 [Pararobbsia alpina]|uniref:Major facilitator superfamily (MFS) profile domain-containing protein n=2 Tax=Pararobbsia alpina TaxID=621374 RepID=A0A6S7BQT8_9BURK|nr:hypothetical protein LMG28138_04045 [Pararobbsia alpina]
MIKDLGLSGTQFGLATTLFYIAYIAFGIPSNIALARIGARRWIGTIMIAWDMASTATLFASSPGTLYLLRVLVGVTEAGFLPGILLYMTYWFPSKYRARANALLPGIGRFVHRHVDLLDDARSCAELPSPRGRHRGDQCHWQHRLSFESTSGGLAERPHA